MHEEGCGCMRRAVDARGGLWMHEEGCGCVRRAVGFTNSTQHLQHMNGLTSSS